MLEVLKRLAGYGLRHKWRLAGAYCAMAVTAGSGELRGYRLTGGPMAARNCYIVSFGHVQAYYEAAMSFFWGHVSMECLYYADVRQVRCARRVNHGGRPVIAASPNNARAAAVWDTAWSHQVIR